MGTLRQVLSQIDKTQRILERISRTWAFIEMFAPGTLIGDVASVRHLEPGNEEHNAALQRLAEKWFTRGACFDSNRGSMLWPHLQARMEETGEGYKTIWGHVTRSAIILACRGPELADVTWRERYTWLRARIRREIMLDLLHGKTLDAIADEPWPETEVALRLEAEYQAELENSLKEVELLEIIEGLTAADLDLLLADHGELPGMASDQGVSYDALRKRRSRLLKKLRGAVSQII